MTAGLEEHLEDAVTQPRAICDKHCRSPKCRPVNRQLYVEHLSASTEGVSAYPRYESLPQGFPT